MSDKVEPTFKSARSAESILVDDEGDKMWADYGRIVHHNLMHPGLLIALNRAFITCNNHIEVAAAVRAFILTGVISHERSQRK